MSRSYRKPYTSYACYFSNKEDKRIANRLFRHINKQLLKLNPDKLKFSLKEISNVWDFASDGLVFYIGKGSSCHFSKYADSEDFEEREFFRRVTQK